MKHPASAQVTAIVLALTAFSVFSVGDVLIKLLAVRYDTFTLAFYIPAMVTVASAVMAAVRGEWAIIRRHPDRKWHLARGILLALQFTLTVYGFSVMPMADVYALLFMAPLATVLLAGPLLGEKPSLRQGLAIIAGFGGVLVVLRPGLIPLDGAAIGMLVAACAFALANILIRFMKDGQQPALMWPFYTELMVTLAVAPFFLRHPVIPALPDLGLMALAAVMSIAALMALGRAFQSGMATTVAPFHYVQMIWAALFGYIVFGDVMDIWTIAGATIITGSGLWLLHETSRRVPVI